MRPDSMDLLVFDPLSNYDENISGKININVHKILYKTNFPETLYIMFIFSCNILTCFFSFYFYHCQLYKISLEKISKRRNQLSLTFSGTLKLPCKKQSHLTKYQLHKTYYANLLQLSEIFITF